MTPDHDAMNDIKAAAEALVANVLRRANNITTSPDGRRILRGWAADLQGLVVKFGDQTDAHTLL